MNDNLLPPCPIVLACDGGYAMPLATALRSLAETNRRHAPLPVHVLHDAFAPALRERVAASLPEGTIDLHWTEVSTRGFEAFARLPHVSAMTFARLMLPRLLPGLQRVLYLDADILVLGDLAGLWQAELGGLPVGAVADFHLDGHLQAAEYGWLAGVPRVQRYFNAGVLLIDLPAFDREGIAAATLAYLRAHPDSPYADQDALNLACDGRWQPLPATWNFQNHHCIRLDRRPPAERPALVHFITSSKPWNPRSTSVNAALYDAVRQRTAFRRSAAERACDAVRTLGWRALHRLQRLSRRVQPDATPARPLAGV